MANDILEARFGSLDRPLKLAGEEIPCFVLEDDTRVLAMTGMLKAMNMSMGRGNKPGQDRLSGFVTTKAIMPFISNELMARIKSPIVFRPPHGGSVAYGYEATILTDICDAVLEARRQGKLNVQQGHIATQCEILVRSFAKVGIIALVDEATGFQYFRAREALEEILDKFIAEELRKWAKTFPDEFYQHLFRLRKWQYVPFSAKRPGAVATYTNDLVYARLAPGVLEELKKKSPTYKPGQRKTRFFQWLTEDVGHPRLREHLSAVIALMKASSTWDQFHRMLQRALPKYNTDMLLPYPEEEDKPPKKR